MLALQTEGLSKFYGSRLAVAEMNLEVRRGEAFGLLGPNGAGKSTCLKMLLGLARPTAGSGRMLGRPLGDAGARRRVGFLPEHFHFQDWLSGAELLRLHGRLYGMASDALRERVPQLLARVGLENQGDKPLRDYSKGMQQRVGLAQALLNDPEILFLDEPTSGLDPLGRRLVREVIAEQRARGVTVFLNSHLLGEVEVSCDRVGFVKGGRLLEVRDVTAAADGPLEVRVRLVGPAGPRLVTHRVAQESELPRLLRELVASGLEVAEFTPLRRSLEEVFLNVVGQQP
ncbi:MAG TPA: ABC transporter ATP-binding protein [Terriglobales bacterium]